MSKSGSQVIFFKDTSALRRGIMPLVVFVVLSLCIFTLSRIGLTLWSNSKEISGHFFEIFVQGIRSDFSIICTMYAPAFLILLLASILHLCKKPLLIALSLYLALVFTVQVVMERKTQSSFCRLPCLSKRSHCNLDRRTPVCVDFFISCRGRLFGLSFFIVAKTF